MKGPINCMKRFHRLAKLSKGGSSVLGWRGIELFAAEKNFGIAGSILALERCTNSTSCRYNYSTKNGSDLSRDFFVQQWLEGRKIRNADAKRRNKGQQYAGSRSSQGSLRRLFSGGFDSYDGAKRPLRQPPMSEPVTGYLKPTSIEEAHLAPLLARSNLLITRDIEWANLAFGFEQENQYAIVDVYYPHSPVGYIREQSNLIMRQLLRSRRPFVAYITDALGNELFRVRRPFWWINSSIYTEVNGKEIGVVHRRWHLWKRIYDLYLGNEQFAVVENPGFWNWTFTLKDINGDVLAEIDRNWRGFGFELLTDAGQYAIRFGTTDSSKHHGEDQQLEVKHPLTLAQRAVAVALAISLDNDYFSRHGGW
ncbi:OLC1v1008058C1 [Oldenlandia corymbosa var. corymbosa]|nr:OLC1v1008058C1 [Oldenlandia corymbosa var. corymbosa]